jgi:hemolysin activation/secretion protein
LRIRHSHFLKAQAVEDPPQFAIKIIAFAFSLGDSLLDSDGLGHLGEFLDANETPIAREFPAQPLAVRPATLLFLTCALWLAPSLSSAQVVAPSRVTPSTLAPPSGPTGALAITSSAGLTPPANAANLFVTVASVAVEGGFPELEAKTAAITARIRGRRVTVAEIFAAANAIEQAYAARGYVLVRVAVPPQQLKNGGTLRLVVIDGFVESVDVKGIPERQRAVVQARLASLIGKRHVTLAEIERRLILASDVPGLVLSSTIERGAQPGGTLLVLEATWTPAVGTLGFDNRLPPSLGTWELNGAVAVNSPFGYGEQFYGAASTGYDLGKVFDATTPMQLLGAGAVLPIGADGWKINPEYTNSVTMPLPFPGAPPDVGYYQRFDLRASYPLVLTRAQALTFQATYEWAQEHLSPIGFDTDIYDDQYDVARLQLEDHLRLPCGLLATTLVFSQGLGGRGETQAALTGVPLSQQGAFPTFSKLGLDAIWTQPLPYALQGVVIGQGQTSFGHPLFIAEQFSLDGAQAASAYPLGTFSVDEGATLRGEIQRPYPFGWTQGVGTAAPYIFGAASQGWIDEPTVLQPGHISAESFGVGLRLGADTGTPILPLGATFAIELARGFSNVAGEGQVYRANVAFAVKF